MLPGRSSSCLMGELISIPSPGKKPLLPLRLAGNIIADRLLTEPNIGRKMEQSFLAPLDATHYELFIWDVYRRGGGPTARKNFCVRFSTDITLLTERGKILLGLHLAFLIYSLIKHSYI